MGSISCHIIDSGLFSGSNDVFRTAVGGYWSDEETEYGSSLELAETSATSPHYKPLEFFYFSAEQETIDDTTIVPNKRVPVRIGANESVVGSDEEWRAIIVGGTWGEKTYSSIFTGSIFQYFNFTYEKPYPAITASAISDYYAVTSEVQISYDYSDYLPRYQDHIKSYDSELLIPNYYIMADISRWNFVTNPEALKLYSSELRNYISIENKYPTLDQIFDFNVGKLPENPPSWVLDMFGEVRTRNTNLSMQYLTSSLVENSLSASTIEWVENKLQTMLFDSEALENFSTMDPLYECLPYKIKITFPAEIDPENKDTPFLDSINDNKFTQKLLKTLYMVFGDKIEELTPTDRNYVKALEYYSIFGETKYSEDEAVDVGGTGETFFSFAQEVNNATYREIDYIKFLAYCYNNYASVSDECMFVGENNIYRAAALEDSATFRHINTRAVATTLNDAIDYISDEANVSVVSPGDLYSDEQTHYETVAYRIEKIGGAGTGDSNTQNVLQNYWFINSEDMLNFEFYDNQVKYGTDYTYRIYAYVLVVGINYNFSDLAITKQLGCEDSTGRVGVEFYDPLSSDEETVDKVYTDESDYFDNSLDNTFASDAQMFSKYAYLADFYLNYEPAVKVVEIPIYSKTLRVLDNPPNVLNVTPYQVRDDSQRIGFDFVYNTFATKTFPSVISENDQAYKQHYMIGKDLLESSEITEKNCFATETC